MVCIYVLQKLQSSCVQTDKSLYRCLLKHMFRVLIKSKVVKDSGLATPLWFFHLTSDKRGKLPITQKSKKNRRDEDEPDWFNERARQKQFWVKFTELFIYPTRFPLSTELSPERISQNGERKTVVGVGESRVQTDHKFLGEFKKESWEDTIRFDKKSENAWVGSQKRKVTNHHDEKVVKLIVLITSC